MSENLSVIREEALSFLYHRVAVLSFFHLFFVSPFLLGCVLGQVKEKKKSCDLRRLLKIICLNFIINL